MIQHDAGDSKPYVYQEYPRHVYVLDGDEVKTIHVETEIELKDIGPHFKHPAEVAAAKEKAAKAKGKKGKGKDGDGDGESDAK